MTQQQQQQAMTQQQQALTQQQQALPGSQHTQSQLIGNNTPSPQQMQHNSIMAAQQSGYMRVQPGRYPTPVNADHQPPPYERSMMVAAADPMRQQIRRSSELPVEHARHSGSQGFTPQLSLWPSLCLRVVFNTLPPTLLITTDSKVHPMATLLIESQYYFSLFTLPAAQYTV
ncbi:hypothetical protein EB796_015090 [Bugula neritina]|uniref:Uncharacterized protein n=1 Tax=Bugula neritina TaxID=10212 RepID=A0A7J7JLW8_BUGNE|nr:hypothetical protein EB796_015090 [Bugula neritina]